MLVETEFYGASDVFLSITAVQRKSGIQSYPRISKGWKARIGCQDTWYVEINLEKYNKLNESI